MVEWVGGGKGGKWKKEREGHILLIGGKLYPLISPAALQETKTWGLKGGMGGGDKKGELRLRWTFLAERRRCNTRRRLGVKPAGEDKRQPSE